MHLIQAQLTSIIEYNRIKVFTIVMNVSVVVHIHEKGPFKAYLHRVKRGGKEKEYKIKTYK